MSDAGHGFDDSLEGLLSCPKPKGLGHDNSPSVIHLGILASGSGSNFEALVHAFDSLPYVNVAVLVCNMPNALVVQRAQRLGIRYECVPHQDFGSRRAFEDHVADVLCAHGVQWVVMAGWMRLMGESFLRRFSGQVLNIHPSLLPSFKGLRALERAWQSKQKIVGCSVHWVVPQMDAGLLIGQAALAVHSGESFEHLRSRVSTLEHQLYPQAILAVLGSACPSSFLSE